MSGPKVVRVVTREELVAVGETLLRRLDTAVADWKQACVAAGSSESQVQQTKARRDGLEVAFREDKFAEFATKATAEIDFLEADAARRLQAAARSRAKERARLESGRQIASVFLSGPSLPEKLSLDLRRAAEGKLSMVELDAVLSTAARSLHSQDAAGLSESQRALANRLAASESGPSFDEWKAGRILPDPRMQSLLEQIAQLELLGESAAAATLQVKLRELQSVGGSAERQLQFDSLQIAFMKAKEAGVRRSKALKESRLLSSELGSFGDAAEPSVRELLSLSRDSDVASLDDAVARASKELEGLRGARAAAARRRVVLDGLTKLGYTVNEGLSTVTPASGKLVMRTPGNSDYGVEISGAGNSERLQVRSVVFTAARNSSNDIPAEQSWCGDFGKLQAALKAQGCDVIVEKAMGVGAVPLKVVETGVEEEVRRPNVSTPARRQGR